MLHFPINDFEGPGDAFFHLCVLFCMVIYYIYHKCLFCSGSVEQCDLSKIEQLALFWLSLFVMN